MVCCMSPCEELYLMSCNHLGQSESAEGCVATDRSGYHTRWCVILRNCNGDALSRMLFFRHIPFDILQGTCP